MAIKTINTHGIELKVDTDWVDDYELLELIKELDQKHTQYLPDVIKLLLGKEQEQKVKDKMVEEHGRCRISDMESIINDVITQLAEEDETAKKS